MQVNLCIKFFLLQVCEKQFISSRFAQTNLKFDLKQPRRSDLTSLDPLFLGVPSNFFLLNLPTIILFLLLFSLSPSRVCKLLFIHTRGITAADNVSPPPPPSVCLYWLVWVGKPPNELFGMPQGWRTGRRRRGRRFLRVRLRATGAACPDHPDENAATAMPLPMCEYRYKNSWELEICG